MQKISLRFRLLLLLSTVLTMAVLYHLLVAGRKDAQTYVVFRYDDYSSGSSKLVEQAIIDNLNKYQFSCSFGVIPFSADSLGQNPVPISSDKIKLISREVKDGMIEICQHGYDHISYTAKAPFSEFKDRPYENQFELIDSAKKLLEKSFNTQITTFIPPWNTYDDNTVKVLSALNESIISADQLQDADNQNFSYVPFTVLPADLTYLTSLRKLPSRAEKDVIVLLLHDYDFKEVVPKTGTTTVDEFSATLKKFSDKNWKVISVREAVKLGLFDNQHYKLNRTKINLLNHIKPIIRPGLLFNKLNSYYFIYLSITQVVLLFFFTVIYYYIIFLILNEIMYFSISRFVAKSNIKYKIWAGGVILIIAMSYYFWQDDHVFGTSEILVLIAMISLLFGTMVSSYSDKSIAFNFKPDLINEGQ